MDWDAFLEARKDTPRQGPGSGADVSWAVALADIPENARICDAGCGPGDDTLALRALRPGASVLGIDGVEQFVEQARARAGDTPGVRFELGDMAQLPRHPMAPFDMVWCAGALYFLGLDVGVRTFADALVPGGVLAFSEPAFFTDTPTEAARTFWEGYPTRAEEDVAQAVSDAGLTVLGQRRVLDAAWEAYYTPLEMRAKALRDAATPAVRAACDQAIEEARQWRALRDQTGYTLIVARKPG